MTLFALRGTPSQNAIVADALARCDFPFELLAPSLAAEGKQAVAVEWADLSARTRAAGGGDHDHDEPHGHADGVHSIERVVDGRRRVLGLFYLPPYTRVVLDVGLEQAPQLAMEVFLAEAAHAVDYHWMVPAGWMRRAVWNALHSIPGREGSPVPESGDVDHGHSWFDGPGGYATWVGEAFMEAFVEAFAPTVPVTIQLDHPVSPDKAVLVREALLPAPPPPAPAPPRDPAARVYRGTYRAVYHDSHRRIEPVQWYESALDAEADGLRPCRTCKPAGGTRAYDVDDDLLDGCGAGDDARGLTDPYRFDPELVALFPGDLVGPVDWLADQWRTLFADGPNPPHVPGAYDVCKVIDSEGEVAPIVAELMAGDPDARAAYGRDLGLGDRLRAEGCQLVEVAGHRTRGSATYAPRAHLSHHTGGPGSALWVIINGRSDLPGPLSQTNTHRDQRVFLVACGRANHAGPGGWLGATGNSQCSGDEADNDGREPWGPQAHVTRSRVAAAQLKGRGLDHRWHCRHAEWADPPGRKPDVHSVIGATMRAVTAGIMRPAPPAPAPPPDPEEDEPMLIRYLLPSGTQLLETPTGLVVLDRGDDLVQEPKRLIDHSVLVPITEDQRDQLVENYKAAGSTNGIINPQR